MRRSKSVGVAGFACMCAVLAVPSGAHADAFGTTQYLSQSQEVARDEGSAQGYTSWSTHSEPGDLVGRGEDRNFTTEDANFNFVGDGTHVRYNLSPEKGYWEANFSAPDGQRLTAGTTYEAATRWGFTAPSSPGLSVQGEGVACNISWGRFTVQQATYDDAGKMLTFAATFEQHCQEDAPALLGSVAWAAGSPPAAIPEPDRTAPGAVSELTAGTDGRYSQLAWTDPEDVDWKGTLVRVVRGRVAPASPTDGTSLGLLRTGHVTWGDDTSKDHSFSAFPVDYSGNLGPMASITLEGSTVTGSASDGSLVAGQDTTLQGRVSDSDTGAGIAGVPVTLYTHDPAAKTYQRVASTTTTRSGSYTLAEKPDRNRLYTLVFPGSARRLGNSVAHDVVVNVAPRISIKVDRARARRGSLRVITAHVTKTSNRAVQLQRRSRGAWRTVTSKQSAETGSVSFTIRPRSRGKSVYRVYKPSETEHVAGWSGNLILRTR